MPSHLLFRFWVVSMFINKKNLKSQDFCIYVSHMFTWIMILPGAFSKRSNDQLQHAIYSFFLKEYTLVIHFIFLSWRPKQIHAICMPSICLQIYLFMTIKPHNFIFKIKYYIFGKDAIKKNSCFLRNFDSVLPSTPNWPVLPCSRHNHQWQA